MALWSIREEQPGDAEAISTMVTAAFAPMPFSDGTEAALIDRLRDDGDLVLSLVAQQDGEMIGHISRGGALALH